MKERKSTINRVGTVKLLSVAMMLLCLTFMTSLNYFLYPSEGYISSQVVKEKNAGSSSNSIPPSGPTEEKSSSSGITMLEEFLHDPHPVINFGIGAQVHLHNVSDAAKILVYHGELLSPPPEL